MKIEFSNRFDERTQFIIDGLNKYNSQFQTNIVPYTAKKECGFYVLENDQIIGGIFGSSDMGNWIHIELFYIDEKFRGKDIGTQLIQKVENYAANENYVGMHLNTWDWQAKGFYEKMGFAVFGKLENHPFGSTRYYLKKELVKD